MRTLILLFAIGILVACGATRQMNGSPLTEAEAKRPSFIFMATMANPMGSRAIPLTPYYEVVISTDSIIAQLPYFGRSYTTTPNTQGGGIQFTSTRFSYDVLPSRKNGWDINIKPADASDIQQLQLSISSSGNAILYVTSTNRQAISFNGFIKKR